MPRTGSTSRSASGRTRSVTAPSASAGSKQAMSRMSPSLAGVDPADAHPHAGAHGVGRAAGVDGVQQPGVGPVEADQRPGEGAGQRLVRPAVGLPRPGGDRALGGQLHQLGQLVAGDRVVLDRRAQHPAVGRADAEHQPLPQPRQEGGLHPPHGAAERVLSTIGAESTSPWATASSPSTWKLKQVLLRRGGSLATPRRRGSGERPAADRPLSRSRCRRRTPATTASTPAGGRGPVSRRPPSRPWSWWLVWLVVPALLVQRRADDDRGASGRSPIVLRRQRPPRPAARPAGRADDDHRAVLALAGVASRAPRPTRPRRGRRPRRGA